MKTPIKNAKLTGTIEVPDSATFNIGSGGLTITGGAINMGGDGAVISSTGRGDGYFMAVELDYDGTLSEPVIDLSYTDSDIQGNFIRLRDADAAITRFTLNEAGAVYSRGGITTGANANPVAPTRAAYKTASTERADNTVIADPDLTVSIGANEAWAFEIWMTVVNDDSTGDWKGGVKFPTAPTGAPWSIAAYSQAGGLSTVYITALDDVSVVIPLPSADPTLIRISGTLINGANAGAITVWWAQNTTDGANATSVGLGARIIATKLNFG